MEDETYAYETQQSSEELLKIKKAELKELKIKAAKDRTFRLANAKNKRAIRDDKLEKIDLKLKTIKEKMADYNRAGKVQKNRVNILNVILNLITNDIELLEEVDRTNPITPVDALTEAEKELYVPEVEESGLN